MVSRGSLSLTVFNGAFVKLRLLAVAAFLSLTGAAGCGDDDPADSGAINSLSFLADGDQFTASNGGAARSGNTVTITGTSTSGSVTRTISIAVQATAAGTIAIGGAGSPTVTYTEQTAGAAAKQWTAGTGAGSGTLVFTQLSAARAIGTFLATLPPVTASGATAAKTITAGSFNLTF
jgi:hypothetical protein